MRNGLEREPKVEVNAPRICLDAFLSLIWPANMVLICGERKRWGTFTKSAPSEVTTGALGAAAKSPVATLGAPTGTI